MLVLCDRYPWPLTNGQNLRIHHYVHQLRGEHLFDLGCCADELPPADVPAFFDRVIGWPRPRAERATGVAPWLDAVRVSLFLPRSA